MGVVHLLEVQPFDPSVTSSVSAVPAPFGQVAFGGLTTFSVTTGRGGRYLALPLAEARKRGFDRDPSRGGGSGAAPARKWSAIAAAERAVGVLRSRPIGRGRGYNASGEGYFADLAAVQDVVRRLLGDLPGYAGGTLFHRGGLAVVGEQGPEILNLPRGAQVLPNPVMQLLRGLGGQGGGPLAGALDSGTGPLREIARLQSETLDALRQKLGLDDTLRNELRSLGSALRRLLSLIPPDKAT